ncbi:MAG: alpha-amylase [Candidatus Aureabacteria bacterium]|nr:alpha-amylase [Candidatus Auribacterota bacterium]
MTKKEPMIIYNIFPRLLGSVDVWEKHIPRIARMKFNWIFINPFHYPGFSGSLYAPKDYYAFNPIFVPEGKDGFKMLASFARACEKKGIRVMMDLVINHSASDSVLVEQHPEWYRREPDGSLMHPFCVDPADTRKKTVWGDLAEIDNSPKAPHRKSLWKYWLNLIKKYADLGFKGFRADAAYKVPSELWEFLISRTKKDYPDSVFFAETLGAEEDDLKTVVKTGFDYVTNSSKWWDFKEEWCPRQYNSFRRHAPSVSFPESHDTPRLFDELSGNINAQKMWYAFSAFFSGGVLMPLGYEWGFRKRVNVVHTMPSDMEEKNIDISDYIKEVNTIKKKFNIFHYDSDMKILTNINDVFFVMLKSSDGSSSGKLLFVLNKDTHNTRNLPFERLMEMTKGWRFKNMIFQKKTGKVSYDPRYGPGETRLFV